MMWPYYGGMAWLWMLGVMVLFWGGVIALVVWAVRASTGHRPPAGGDPALETLRRRLAAGEISQEEYERTRKILLG